MLDLVMSRWDKVGGSYDEVRWWSRLPARASGAGRVRRSTTVTPQQHGGTTKGVRI